MSDPIRLAIVGSTQFEYDANSLKQAAQLVFAFIREHEPEIVISGGAIGIDKLAANAARNFGVTVIEYLPKHPRWAPEGYKERNLLIAQNCTHLLCIRHTKSKTYGAGWTADQAEKLGKTVWRYVI